MSAVWNSLKLDDEAVSEKRRRGESVEGGVAWC